MRLSQGHGLRDQGWGDKPRHDLLAISASLSRLAFLRETSLLAGLIFFNNPPKS
jgi:hypothetical protein